MIKDFLTKGTGIDMGIDFGGTDVFVPKQGLDETEVGTTLKQGCGKGMAQGVGRDGFLDASLFGLSLNHDKYHGTSEVGTATIKEHIVFFARFNLHQVAIVKPIL